MSLALQVQDATQQLTEFVRNHGAWAAPLAGVLAFAESLAFVSLLVPAWAVLVALGALTRESGIGFWPILFSGAVGAALGDWLSYWIGLKVGPAAGSVWPLSRDPTLLQRGQRFVARWGVLAILIGRFFGPLRAVVPLAAGIFRMPWRHFQAANFVSAFIWVALVLTLGDVVGRLVQVIWRH